MKGERVLADGTAGQRGAWRALWQRLLSAEREKQPQQRADRDGLDLSELGRPPAQIAVQKGGGAQRYDVPRPT